MEVLLQAPHRKSLHDVYHIICDASSATPHSSILTNLVCIHSSSWCFPLWREDSWYPHCDHGYGYCHWGTKALKGDVLPWHHIIADIYQHIVWTSRVIVSGWHAAAAAAAADDDDDDDDDGWVMDEWWMSDGWWMTMTMNEWCIVIVFVCFLRPFQKKHPQQQQQYTRRPSVGRRYPSNNPLKAQQLNIQFGMMNFRVVSESLILHRDMVFNALTSFGTTKSAFPTKQRVSGAKRIHQFAHTHKLLKVWWA